MGGDSVLRLQEPLTEGGIRAVNFFNGRLLTGKDLSREQQARREADWRLGLALGEGVAFGLEVEKDQPASQPGLPVARIKAGLAFNRQGQALRLTEPVSVALARRFEAGAGTDCLFAGCAAPDSGSYTAGAGLYVLTIAPATASEGRAANNGFDPANVRCNTDATVEAVQFRLLWVNPALYAGLNAGAAWFRNAIAYLCFGSGAQPDWLAGLLDAPPRRDDLLESLRQNGVLSEVDVPLGLLFFTGVADLRFIDLWSVRRPLARGESGGVASLAEGHRLAVGRAMFQQFQAQIAELSPVSGGLGNVTAQSHFRYLPPVGIIPVAEETDGTDAQATRFFAGMTYRAPVFINAARLEALVRASLCYPPIDTQGEEMLWLYRVRENRMAIDGAQAGQGKPRSYLAFASGHLPYCGQGQYDLSYYDYGNYLPGSSAQ
jgi:hypothetical protein